MERRSDFGWRRLAQNAASLGGLQSLQMLLPLVLIPFLAKTLGPQAWAGWAIADALGRHVSIVIEYGFMLSATRAVAQARPAEGGTVAAGVLGAQAFLAAFALPAAFFLIWFFPWQGTPLMWCFACLWAVFQGLSPAWFLVGTERAWLLLWIECPIRLFLLGGILLTINGPQDAWIYFAWMSGGSAAIAAAGWLLVWLETRPLRFSLAGSEWMLRKGAPVFAFRGAVSLYTTANVLLLGVFASPAAVAAFAGAEKIARAVVSLIAPVSQSFYPRISRILRNDTREAARAARVSAVLMIALGLSLGTALWLLAPLAVRLLLGPGFEDSVLLLRALAPLAPLVAASNMLGIQWMLPLRLDRQFTTIVLIAGLANLALVPILVPRLGPLGSACAAVLAECFVTAGCWWALSARRLTPWHNYGDRLRNPQTPLPVSELARQAATGCRREGSVQPIPLDPLPAEPLVAVLIANYNYEQFIDKAIASLQSQTWRRWEAWICDDGSTDRSPAIIAAYARGDPRIHLLTQPNRGMAAALNTAHANSRGNLVALLDSDDEWKPRRLERVVRAFLANPAAGLVTHPVCAVRAGMEILKPLHPRKLDEGWLGPHILEGAEPGLPPCSGLTFHAAVARRVFPLPAHFRQCADKIAQDRAALITPVAVVREPLAFYRQHGANLTGLGGPVTLPELERKFEFLERLWEDREEFVLREHGFKPDRRPWQEQENAHLYLARLVLGAPVPAGFDRPSRIQDPARRAVWSILLALPRPVAARLLEVWWTENTVKRFIRNAWDLLRPGGLRQHAASP